MKRYIKVIIFLFVFCITLCGCSHYSRPSEEPGTGVEISIDALKELWSQFNETRVNIEDTHNIIQVTDAPDTSEDIIPSDTSDNSTVISSTTVYWTEGGEVWHTKQSCSSLSRSKNIYSGSIDKAMEAGKERACKRCS